MKEKRIGLFLRIFLCMVLVFGLTACGSEKADHTANTQPDAKETSQDADKKEKIAAVTDADMYEIVPAEPYSSADLDWNDDDSRTTTEMNDKDARPEIGSGDVSLEGYSRVYIGYPKMEYQNHCV